MPSLSFLELLRPYKDDVCLVFGKGLETEIVKEQLLSKVSAESLCSGPAFSQALAQLDERSFSGADVVYADLRGEPTVDNSQFFGRLPFILNEGGRAVVLVADETEGEPLKKGQDSGVYSAMTEEDLGTGWMVWVRRSLEGC